MLQATRLLRKGFETSILLYGPGVTLGVQRGFPKIGDEAFPGHQNFNNQITKFIGEGGKVYACRFALQALYGHGEPSLIEGIKPISPLDVLDLVLHPPARQRLHPRYLDAVSSFPAPVAAVVDRGLAVIECLPETHVRAETAVNDRGYIGRLTIRT